MMPSGYELHVGVECSGFKVTIALLTFILFFFTIVDMPLWKKLILPAALLPIAVISNGLAHCADWRRGARVGFLRGEGGARRLRDDPAHLWHGQHPHDGRAGDSDPLRVPLSAGEVVRMEEMKPQQESTATIQEPDVLTPSDGVASAIPANGAAAQESPASDASAEVIQPRPAPPMDWKRFGAPLTVLMFLTIGLVLTIQFMPRPQPTQQAETLNKIPTVIGEWSLLQEYPMSEAALNELKPDEYVARIYVNSSGEQADLSIIAGSHTGAFHNPQVCFRVQNWEFAENESITLNVPEREPIPARFVRLISLDGQRREAVGIYFYSTPMGYRDDTSTARIFLLLARLTGMDQQRAYFVRFLKGVSGDPQRDRESVKQFAEQVLAAMRETNPEVVR
jgi:EpsI family protein